MDIFESSPKEKFFDILFNANRNLVENEIENLLFKLATFEEICYENGIRNDEILKFSIQNQEKIENSLNDIFIQSTSNILSNNE